MRGGGKDSTSFTRRLVARICNLYSVRRAIGFTPTSNAITQIFCL